MDTEVDVPPESYINDRRQDWLTELSAQDYDRCMSLLEEVLGIPYRYSPEATAAALLRSLHDRPGGKRLQVAEMPPPALEPTTERDLFWIRPLTDSEQAAPYIVAYDVNAAYLAACSALPLGVGKPRYTEADAFLVLNDPGWGPNGAGYVRTVQGWVTTVTAAYNQHSFDAFWVWGETSRPLEPWYKVLREARSELMYRKRGVGLLEQIWLPAIEAGLQTVKMMYCGFFGRCASTKWDRTGDPLFRPDWRHMVIATRRTRLQRVMTQCDPAPFAAYSDCLYFATEKTVTGLRMGTNPGSFKIHGTVRNEDEVRSVIADGKLSRLVELVKD